MSLAIGIDLGGTNIKGGIVARDGSILHRAQIATNAAEGVDVVVDRLADLARTLGERAEAKQEALGIGVGSPGMIRQSDGVVLFSPNLNGWHDVPLVAMLKERLGRTIVLNNDANNAALGEFSIGAGRGRRNMVMLTLGTGVGGGIIANGRLLTGSRGNAGELGHTIVEPGGRPCGCGQLGCLEAYSSATATAERAIEQVRGGADSTLRAVHEQNGTLTTVDVVNAAEAGDETARFVWDESCRYLAIACVNFQHIFDPDCIVLAGGMSDAGDFLLSPVRSKIAEIFSPNFGTAPEILPAMLGNDAGMVGAAFSAMSQGPG